MVPESLHYHMDDLGGDGIKCSQGSRGQCSWHHGRGHTHKHTVYVNICVWWVGLGWGRTILSSLKNQESIFEGQSK